MLNPRGSGPRYCRRAALAALPAERRAFAETLATLDPGLVAYKSMGGIKDAVVRYLTDAPSS